MEHVAGRWGIEGDAGCHGDTINALKTEQFPNPEQNDWAYMPFLFHYVHICFSFPKCLVGVLTYASTTSQNLPLPAHQMNRFSKT